MNMKYFAHQRRTYTALNIEAYVLEKNGVETEIVHIGNKESVVVSPAASAPSTNATDCQRRKWRVTLISSDKIWN